MRRIIFVLLALGIILAYFRWPDRTRVAVVTSSRSEAVLDILAERGLADDVRSKLEKFRLAHPNHAEASGVASGIQALLAQRAHANTRRTRGN